MKKIVFILFIFFLIFTFHNNEIYIIPQEAIRFRIIANSNDIDDQIKKAKIKEDLSLKLQDILSNVSDYHDANLALTNNLPEIEQIVKEKTDDYQIKLGLNYFPEKSYKNVIYPEGQYNSLVITLGNGLGNNWWCVLYPPLCFIDEESISDAEYSLFVKDIFNKNTN